LNKIISLARKAMYKPI